MTKQQKFHAGSAHRLSSPPMGQTRCSQRQLGGINCFPAALRAGAADNLERALEIGRRNRVALPAMERF